MTTDVPTVTPQVRPVLLTVATDVLLLLQVPPDVALNKVVHEPTHIFAIPVIAAGEGITVTEV